MTDEPVLPPCPVPQHEHDIDKQITEGFAKALGERKVRLTDRRLLIIFVLFILLLAGVGRQQKHAAHAQHQLDATQQQLHATQQQQQHDFGAFQRAIHANCDKQQLIVDKANELYDRQIKAIQKRRDLSAADKAVLLKNYQQAKFPSLACAELPGG